MKRVTEDFDLCVVKRMVMNFCLWWK